MLTKGIDEIQRLFNITRTDWQIINSINQNTAVEKSVLIELMKPFANPEQAEAVLTRVQNENLVKSEHGSSFTLTEKGQELHKACLEQQRSFRQQVMTGISGEDYETTIHTLTKIIENINKPEAILNGSCANFKVIKRAQYGIKTIV